MIAASENDSNKADKKGQNHMLKIKQGEIAHSLPSKRVPQDEQHRCQHDEQAAGKDTEENIDGLFRAIKDVGVDYFYVDRLNRRFGVWQALRGMLEEYAPDLIKAYRGLFFNEVIRQQYYGRFVNIIRRLAAGYGLEGKMRLCF